MRFERHDEEIGQLAQRLFYLDPAIKCARRRSPNRSTPDLTRSPVPSALTEPQLGGR